MRDFFIRSLEIVINVVVVLALIAIVAIAGMVAFGGGRGMGPMGFGGPLAGLMILIGGILYLIIVAGFMYLGLGIYQNTKRTAEAIERSR